MVLIICICIKGKLLSSKYCMHFCKRNKERLQADALALSYNNDDVKKFWNGVTSATNSKATSQVNVIGGTVGEQNMWCNHFRQLYNSVHTDSDISVPFMNQLKTWLVSHKNLLLLLMLGLPWNIQTHDCSDGCSNQLSV